LCICILGMCTVLVVFSVVYVEYLCVFVLLRLGPVRWEFGVFGRTGVV